jgi:hypothetical protein
MLNCRRSKDFLSGIELFWQYNCFVFGVVYIHRQCDLCYSVVLKELVQITKGHFSTFVVGVINQCSNSLITPLQLNRFLERMIWMVNEQTWMVVLSYLILNCRHHNVSYVVGVTLLTSFWTREERPICLAECSEKEEKEAPWADTGRADPGGRVLCRIRSQSEVFVELWLRSTTTSRAVSLWWWSRQNRDLGLRPTRGSEKSFP